MARRTDTRQRVLHTAVELFRTQGYHGTGLNQVLADGGAPKGSLYFHFPGGKEQLAVEAVTVGGAELCAMIAAVLAAAPNPVSGLDAIIDAIATDLANSDYRHGCPIATVAHDTTGNDPIRRACATAFDSLRAAIEDFLARHDVPNADDLATTLLAAIEGAQLLARNHKDTAPLYAVARQLRGLLHR
jgi:TetR/AcrR family transcriptional repressor of lmrAB and yxaGH operons